MGNSLCHRDYSNPKGNEVAIFKDRIEIYNPGQFPDEIDPDDFIKGRGHSILRNPLIAETMFRSEDIEKWASGIRRIYEECQKNNIKVEFNRVKTGFVVVFYRPKWEEGEGLGEGSQESKGKSKGKAIEIIAQNSLVTIPEIASALDMSIAGIEKIIRALKKEGRLRRVGPTKGGHWEISA